MTLVAAFAVSSDGEMKTHYGVIFDAGSSGTRIHVYTWRSGGRAGDFWLIEDDLVKEKPGLSSFAKKPQAAGQSLRHLLEHARKKVPKESRVSTPAFLMATAGLRAVGEKASHAILESARDVLEASPFLFQRDWAYILSGKEEGIFGWVTVNYLRGSILNHRGRPRVKDPPPPTAVIDLGGGSVQFVYSLPPDVAAPTEYGGEIDLAGRKYNLYAASHMHFGLDHARERLGEALSNETRADAHPGRHPCIPDGHETVIKAGQHEYQPFLGSGTFEGCADAWHRLFSRDAACATFAEPPCTFDKSHQPELPADIFGFSYLYDRTRAIGLLDGVIETFGTQHMTINDIERAAKALCAMEASEQEKRCKDCDDFMKWRNFCGDATYLAVLLRHGFGISSDSTLTMGNKVNGVELVWTLGAIIMKTASMPQFQATYDSYQPPRNDPLEL